MDNTLFIFDFDDTLVFSGAVVHITHADGSKESLESHEFATYQEQPGDQFDYSEFEVYPPNGKIIKKTFAKLLEVISVHGPDNVMVLSARGNAEPMRQFLSDHGLSANIEIVGVGSANPSQKAAYVDQKLQTNKWTSVEVFEDSLANINAIGAMIKSKYPRVFFLKNHIQAEGILRKTIYNLLKELFCV